MSDTLKVTAPFDEHLIEEIPMAGEGDLERALSSAQGLFDSRDSWLPKYHRIEILEKTAALMEDQKEDLVKIAAEEGGKPYTDSVVEVNRAIEGVKLAVHHLYSLAGREIPMGLNKASDHHLAFTTLEPVGPVLSYSAFNHPLNLIVHQVIPPLAVGAPVIIKPALATPRSCLKLVGILKEAGLPQNWVQVLIISNELAVKAVQDSRVSFFSFIGSSVVGEMLKSKLPPGVGCALEHGGAAPVILDRDADWKAGLPGLIKAGFYHAGQVCVSVQRIFAHESIVEEFSQAYTEAAAKLRVGNPLDAGTEVGPLIRPESVDRTEEWVAEARKAGAAVLTGGKKLSKTTYSPTVLRDPPDGARVSRQEIFGPVVNIYSYKNLEDAIRRANQLPFAFQASIYTRNIDTALEGASRLKAAAVFVNQHTAFRVDWMPFGGFQESGLGFGGIPYSMRDMVREKMIVIKKSANLPKG